jgi:hypothetical protein
MPLIFEPPAALTGGVAEIWAAISGGTGGVANPNWGGANVWASLDGTSYTLVGRQIGAAKQGVTTAALAAPTGGNPDTTNTLAVSLAESAGLLSSATTAAAQAGATLCIVGGELLAYATATLTGPNAYALTTLERGLYGSTAQAHASGAGFARLDESIFKYALPDAYVGQPLYLKFQSFNTFGAATQDLSTCTAYTITPRGTGATGPVTAALAVGSALDYSLASLAVTETDDWGLASDGYVQTIDLGLASDPATASLMSLGAAAAGANDDITSLGALTGLAVTINKAGVGATGAILSESSGAARASMGLLASDRWRLSVSADGASFAQAIDVDPATGHVGLAGYTADASNGLGVLGTNFLFAAAIDSCRFGFNKAATANDASLSFQTGFSARALAGLLGSDGYQLKVSPDGATFYQVYVADQTTGNVAFKALIGAAAYVVSALPGGFNGALAFASNGRKAGEAAGAGTGVVVAYSNGAWRRLSDDSVVTA